MRSTLSLKLYIILLLVLVGINYTQYAAVEAVKKTRYDACRVSNKKYYEPTSCKICCQKKGSVDIDTAESHRIDNCVCVDSDKFKPYGSLDNIYAYGSRGHDYHLGDSSRSHYSNSGDSSRGLHNHPGDYSGHPGNYGHQPVNYGAHQPVNYAGHPSTVYESDYEEVSPYYSQPIPKSYGHAVPPPPQQVYQQPMSGTSSAATSVTAGSASAAASTVGGASAAAATAASRRPRVQQVPYMMPHMQNPAMHHPVHGFEYEYPGHAVGTYPGAHPVQDLPHVPFYTSRGRSRRGDFSDSDSDSDFEFDGRRPSRLYHKK